MKTYDEYTVRISNEPSYYGSTCTETDAARIVSSLTDLIKSEYPGITVEIFRDGEHSTCMLGPDAETCRDIEQWIADNWTAAL